MRGSWPLEEVVNIAASKNSLPDVSPDRIKNSAWMLWHAVRNRAIKDHAPQVARHRVEGLEWRGNVKAVARTLWGGLKLKPNRQESAQAAHARTLLYKYLAQTGNMVCEERNLGMSRWWIRNTFNDAPVSVVSVQSFTARERKLTPEEAGETRPAEPVTTKFKCTFSECAETFDTTHSRMLHIYSAHKSVTEWVLESLRSLPPPVNAGEVFRHAQSNGFTGSPAGVLYQLKQLHESHKVERYYKPGSTRTANSVAYWALRGQRVNPDWHKPRCREPGCNKPFKDASLRLAHEAQAHPRSVFRVWHCQLSYDRKTPCQATFYDYHGFSGHTYRGHTEYSTEEVAEAIEKARVLASNLQAELGVPQEQPTVPDEEKPSPAEAPAPAVKSEVKPPSAPRPSQDVKPEAVEPPLTVEPVAPAVAQRISRLNPHHRSAAPSTTTTPTGASTVQTPVKLADLGKNALSTVQQLVLHHEQLAAKLAEMDDLTAKLAEKDQQLMTAMEEIDKLNAELASVKQELTKYSQLREALETFGMGK